MDFALARKHMADGQLRPNHVTDTRLLAVMQRTPRERFLPAAQASLAYLDENLPLGGGRYLTAPMPFARLAQLLNIQPEERVLLLGAGCGYSAVVLALLGAAVIAVEEDSNLALQADRTASSLLPGLAAELGGPRGSVAVITGALAEGHAAGAPYGAILIEGEISEIPPALVEQLTEGGRVVTVLREKGQIAKAVLATRRGAGLSFSTLFDCTLPTLPSLCAEPGFAF